MNGPPQDSDPELDELLIRNRPLPDPDFRSALREVLLDLELGGDDDRSRTATGSRYFGWISPQLAMGVCSVAGAGLLAIAIIGVAGVGPYAA